jgi:hypothetical protein
MSTLETDLIQASTGTNTAIKIKGKGSGVVKIGDGELSFPDADGSANQIIKTDGSGTLSFTAQPSGGAWSVKSSGTFSTASQLDVTSISKYTQIILSNVTFSAGAQMEILTSTDNGSSFATSNYHYHIADYDSSRSNPTDVIGYVGTTASAILTSGNNMGTASTDEGHYVITIPNPADAAAATIIKIELMKITASAANVAGGTVVAMNPTAADVDCLRCRPNTGTMSGSYVVLELN